jgi:hypothetical protein
MDKLKPCPCGGKVIVKKEDPYDGDYVAICMRCNAWIRGRTQEEAIEYWNRKRDEKQ